MLLISPAPFRFRRPPAGCPPADRVSFSSRLHDVRRVLSEAIRFRLNYTTSDFLVKRFSCFFNDFSRIFPDFLRGGGKLPNGGRKLPNGGGKFPDCDENLRKGGTGPFYLYYSKIFFPISFARRGCGGAKSQQKRPFRDVLRCRVQPFLFIVFLPGTGGRRYCGSPLSGPGRFSPRRDQSSFLLLEVSTRNAASAITMQPPTARTLLSEVGGGGGSIGMVFVIAVTVPSTTVDVSL